jgi:hypothetical protein
MHDTRGRMRRCNSCRQKRWLYTGDKVCGRCKENLWRKAHGLCTAVICHGPGHQSTTYCEQRVGDGHRMRDGRKLHTAVYGEFRQFAEWVERRAFSGYFDEPLSGG